MSLSDIPDFMKDDMITKFGIDKLELLIAFLPLTCSAGSKKEMDRALIDVKMLIEKHANREMKTSEYTGMLTLLLKWAQSEPATNERISATDDLYNLKFMEE